MFSLAKFKKTSPTHNRVKRSLDTIDIVYPSDSPITDPPLPVPEPETPSLIVSNDVSVVYPQSFNPKVDRQSAQKFLAGLNFSPAATILPINDLTTTSFSTTMTLSSTSTLPSSSPTNNPVSAPAPTLDPTTVTVTTSEQHTARPVRTTNINSYSEDATFVPIESDDIQKSEDYEDWGVVVSVVKSVSESDSSVKLIQQLETTPSLEDGAQEMTTTRDETTTIAHQLTDNVTLKPKPLPFKSHPTSNLHPLLTANKISNSSSTFGHHKIHPFLHQIKSPTQATAKGVTNVPRNITNPQNNVSSSVHTTPSTSPTLATGLFNRFSFLNKGKRPDFTTKRTSSEHSVPSSSSKPKSKTLSSRLSGFKRPSFRSSGFKKADKENISKEIEDAEKNTESSFKLKKTNFLSRFKSKSALFRSASSTTEEPKGLVDKPRPKRLPSPFSGSRPESLFKPRHHRLLAHSAAPATETKENSESSTEKQTVGEIIAQLNGDEDEDATATLRPHAFKPKSGVSSKIREHLLAELADVKKEVEETPTEDIRTVTESHSSQSRTPSSQRLTTVERKHLSPFSSGRTRLRSRSKLHSPIETSKDNVSSGKLGVTVVSHVTSPVSRDPVPRVTHDSLGTAVDIVHDRESLTKKEHEISSTNSPFQVLLDGTADNNESVATEDGDDEDDHLHDLVHEHHPEIHFRHLNPDVLTTETSDNVAGGLDMFLPTMPAQVESAVDTGETASTVSAAPVSQKSTDSVARSRGRSRYRPRPAPSAAAASSRSALAEQRRNRIQVRRRNRVEVSRDENNNVSDNISKETSSDRRVVSRQRSRFRSKPVSGATAAEEDSPRRVSETSRFTNPRRLRSRSRSRTSVSQPQPAAPEFQPSAGQRSRGRVAVARTTEEELAHTAATVAIDTSPTDITIEDKQTLEGKFTTVDLETTTEGVVTTLTLNSNEENSEVQHETTERPEDVSTLRPGKFKPKYGSETRNKLREKLRQELLNNKTGSAGGPANDILSKLKEPDEIHNQFNELPIYDTEFSDFDIDPTIVESPTTAVISFENDEYFDSLPFSPAEPRAQRRTDDAGLKRKRSHNSQQDQEAGHRRLQPDPGLYRHSRSTAVTENSFKITEALSRSQIKKENLLGNTEATPFLLRGGKGYKKGLLESHLVDKQFSEYRAGMSESAEKEEENTSGPNFDQLFNPKKIRSKKNEKKYISYFGDKEFTPSVGLKSTEPVTLNIYLDSEVRTTFAPNTLTTSDLTSTQINSSPQKPFKKLPKFRVTQRKFPNKISTTPPKEDLVLNDKVDFGTQTLGIQLTLSAAIKSQATIPT